MDAFKITGSKGFQMTFNGYTVSVQFGPGNYADMPGGRFQEYDNARKAAIAGKPWTAETAEIAVWPNVGDKWIRLQRSDDVVGWVTAEKVARVLGYVASITNENRETVTAALQAILGGGE